MFSSNFTPDMTAWLPDAINILNNDEIPQPVRHTKSPRSKPRSPRTKPRTPTRNKNVKVDDGFTKSRHRSHSPVNPAQQKRKIVLRRSLSVNSPTTVWDDEKVASSAQQQQRSKPPKSKSPRNKPTTPNRNKKLVKVDNEGKIKHRSHSPVNQQQQTKKLVLLQRSLSENSLLDEANNSILNLIDETDVYSSKQRKPIKPSSAPDLVPKNISSPRSNKIQHRRRPAPVLTNATSAFDAVRPGHCSEDPQPSPKVNKLAHLSEEAPMSPKVMVVTKQQPSSLLGRMIQLRKRHGVRGVQGGAKPMHIPHYQHCLHVDAQTEQNSGIVSPPTVEEAKEEVDMKWDYTSRPDIHHSELKSGTILDKRHTSRSVRCVNWKKKRNSDDDDHKGEEEEKFALKMIMRTSKLDHVFNEKDIMLTLNSPWHTKLIKTFCTDNNLYMLMDYAEHGSLNQRISWGRGLKQGTPELIAFYGACLVKAIQYMHKRGVVHRDIKPDNLLIGSDGYLKVCDYGLSKFLPKGERTTTFLGTLAYMPPEQMDGSAYDHSVDYWGLGITVHEMAFGMTPFEPTQEMLSEKEWQSALKANVLKAVVHFPPKSVGFPLKLFIKSLLVRDVGSRLGGDPFDLKRIESHSFFAKIDWDSIYHRTMVPPTTQPYSFLGTML